ncbi:MAG TPA: hypothetical protein ENI42_01625 [Thermoplasmatales archaeon]|nr:hypothetical protein [Thermoplasmatales archaeon]
MKNPVKLTSVLMLLMLTTSVLFFTTPSAARPYILHSKSDITITPEASDLGVVDPGESVGTTLKIVYSYTKFAEPQGFLLLSSKPTNINVSIESKPSWCSVEVDKTRFSAKIPAINFLSGGNISFSVKLNVTVADDAPGYEDGRITVKVEAAENGNIPSCENTTTVKVKPSFVPEVEVETTGYWIRLEPGNSTMVDINVTNTGNMVIVARLNLTGSLPKTLSVTLPSETQIDVGETKTLKVMVKANESEDYVNVEETIPLTLTYHAKNYDSLTGDPTDILVEVRVKSERKPSFTIDPLVAVIVVAVIILVAAFVFILKYSG